MANIDSKNLLVWLKAMYRGQPLPLDATEIHASLDDALAYAASAVAYEGQTIKAKLDDGKYHEFIIQPSDSGLVLEEVVSTPSVAPTVDNETIGTNESGLMQVMAVPIARVTGLVDKLTSIEKQALTFVTRDEVRAITELVAYDVPYKPEGTLVNYYDREIRIMCPAHTAWAFQNPGANGDPGKYYIGFKSYAPDDSVASFKEDLAEIITDSTMYYFENNDFAGIDEYGRKYSIVWLPVAEYDEATQEWTYYGRSSSGQKFVGWYYSVEWYNANGVKIAADTVRINLSNEDCHVCSEPYYVSDIKNALDSIENSVTWGEM